MFLEYYDEEDGQQYLWAVPVLNLNLQYNEMFVNRGKNIQSLFSVSLDYIHSVTCNNSSFLATYYFTVSVIIFVM